VDAATTTTITSVKSDIVAWGVVFIEVALTIFAQTRQVVGAVIEWMGR
jgi:hypothetical protein